MLILFVAPVLIVGVIMIIWWANEQAKKRLAALAGCSRSTWTAFRSGTGRGAR